MKYFTQKLLNNDSTKSDYEWEVVCQKYYNSLKNLIDVKISKDFFEFYKSNDAFHDFVILNIEYTNSKADIDSTNKLILTTFHNGKNYNIVYNKVDKFEYGIKYTDNLKYVAMRKNGIDVILYDEILDQNNLMLSHELLLVSGGIMKVYCSEIYIKTQ